MRLDSEMIIIEVQKYPELYNTRDKNYKNRNLKFDSWKKVTEAVVGDRYWKFQPAKQYELAKEVQQKWKRIKDAYIRTLKTDLVKDENEGIRRRPYVYYHQLSFLQPILENRSSIGKVEDTSMTEIIEEQLLETTESPQFFQNLKDKCKNENLETLVIKILKDSEQNQSALTSFATDSDADKMFLLSLLPKIKLLTPDDAFDFQIKVMQLLQSFMSDNTNLKDPYSL